MRTNRSLWVTLFLAGSGGLLPFAGCSRSDSGNAGVGEGGEAGASGAPSAAGAAGQGGSATEGGAAGGPSIDGGAGGEGGVVAAGGAGGEGGGAPTCDPTAADDPDDDFADTNCDGIDGDAARAVFVAPAGSDDSLGTIEQPVATVSRALVLAAQKQFDVYVCNATYRDNVVIKSGVRIFGGYDCARSWIRVKDRAVIQPQSGLPLFIESVTTRVSIERVAFRSGNGRSPGASSQAGGILNSNQVRLSHVEFVAGDGAKGADGAPGAPAPSDPPPAPKNGADGSSSSCDTDSPSGACAIPAAGGSNTWHECVFDGATYKTFGGPGGNGANPWTEQQRPACLAFTFRGTRGDVGWYEYASQLKFANAQDVAVQNGTSGAGAAMGIGKLDAVLYVASNAGSPGTSGRPGMPGAGGDGGSGWVGSADVCAHTFLVGSGGGQGGFGGCGGQGGSPGLGGGGSIALAIVNSQVTLEWARLATGNGGDGGDGAAGGAGQPGGPGGQPGTCVEPRAQGLPGTSGTPGGVGGSGGPGGGGPSIGLLYVGAAPAVSNVEFSLGVPGNGGVLAGGAPAAIGVTASTYSLSN